MASSFVTISSLNGVGAGDASLKFCTANGMVMIGRSRSGEVMAQQLRRQPRHRSRRALDVEPPGSRARRPVSRQRSVVARSLEGQRPPPATVSDPASLCREAPSVAAIDRGAGEGCPPARAIRTEPRSPHP